MNSIAKIVVLICCALLCNCERRANGSKIYNGFDPVPVVLDFGKKKNYEFSLTSETEEGWEEDYHAITWRFHSRSDIDDIKNYSRDICNRFETDMRDAGAVTKDRDERSGSFVFQSINYSIENRTGWIILEATKNRDGTDLKIQLREAEQAAPCNP
jgi:hypothetical protein